MATKIKFESEDMIPNENNDPMMSILDQAREEILNENKEETEETKKPEETTTKKKTTSTRKKKSSLSARDVMTQKKENLNRENPIISDRNEVVTDMKIRINELLPNMKIDLNNITISDSLNSMEKHTNMQLVFNSKPTFEVALCQSCYGVFMEALKYNDIDAITNSTMDEYHTTLKMYQIIHNRIQATTIGQINFDTFIECTSFFDLQSLYYGLHMQTFPGKTKFDFTCAHCKHSFSTEIENDSLIFSKDPEIFKRLDKVRNEAHSPDAVMRDSLLSKHERICLNQSKTIIDIRVPSLKDQLDLLKSVPADRIDEMSDDLATLLFIKNIYLLNVPETLEKNSPVYYAVMGNAAQINVLKELSISDTKQLADEVEKWTNKYKTEYRIPSFKCPSCQKELGDMTVDMESVLFRLMLNQ